MQIILLASRPVTPAPPFAATFVTRRTHIPIQIQLHFAVVQHHRQLRAAGMEVEPARLAVVDKAGDVALAGVAVAGLVTRWPREEDEGAFGVERVID